MTWSVLHFGTIDQKIAAAWIGAETRGYVWVPEGGYEKKNLRKNIIKRQNVGLHFTETFLNCLEKLK